MKKLLIHLLLILLLFFLIWNLYSSENISHLRKETNIQEGTIKQLYSEIDNYKNKISDLGKEIETLNEEIAEISEIKNYHPFQDIYPIDIKQKKCIEKSNDINYINCAYYSKKEWEQEITKHLSILKKEMPANKYNIIVNNQKVWKNSINQDFTLIDEYIVKNGGIVDETIAENLKSNIYKTRAIFLNSISYNYLNKKEFLL